jgi:hypothetical protein
MYHKRHKRIPWLVYAISSTDKLLALTHRSISKQQHIETEPESYSSISVSVYQYIIVYVPDLAYLGIKQLILACALTLSHLR